MSRSPKTLTGTLGLELRNCDGISNFAEAVPRWSYTVERSGVTAPLAGRPAGEDVVSASAE